MSLRTKERNHRARSSLKVSTLNKPYTLHAPHSMPNQKKTHHAQTCEARARRRANSALSRAFSADKVLFAFQSSWCTGVTRLTDRLVFDAGFLSFKRAIRSSHCL